MNASIRCLRWSFEVKLPRRSSLLHQDREPDLDLVDPGRVLWREVEVMRWLGRAGTPRALPLRRRMPDLPFLAEIVLDAAQFGHETDDAFGHMGVEVVADHAPRRGRRGRGEQILP